MISLVAATICFFGGEFHIFSGEFPIGEMLVSSLLFLGMWGAFFFVVLLVWKTIALWVEIFQSVER